MFDEVYLPWLESHSLGLVALIFHLFTFLFTFAFCACSDTRAGMGARFLSQLPKHAHNQNTFVVVVGRRL